MRFLLWTAVAWLLMALAIVAIDVGQTAFTGVVASQEVTQQIDYTPEQDGLFGWMERVSRRIDKVGDRAFGRFTPLAELLIYGGMAPLLIAGPIGWEARRRGWSLRIGGWIAGSAGLLLAVWALSKPGLPSIFYALVNALLLCCRALGLSYYTGSFLYFILLPPACLVAYIGIRVGLRILPAGGSEGRVRF